MKKLLLREAAKHKLQNRRRKRWQKTVSILACLVVFCTVYALILPALTAEADIYCGKEEHTHTCLLYTSWQCLHCFSAYRPEIWQLTQQQAMPKT